MYQQIILIKDQSGIDHSAYVSKRTEQNTDVFMSGVGDFGYALKFVHVLLKTSVMCCLCE